MQQIGVDVYIKTANGLIILDSTNLADIDSSDFVFQLESSPVHVDNIPANLEEIQDTNLAIKALLDSEAVHHAMDSESFVDYELIDVDFG